LNNGDNVSVIMTSNAGCVTTATANSNQISITVTAAPVVKITDPPAVCAPATVDITALSVNTGSDPGLGFTYWTNAAATIPLSNPGAVAVSGTYYIKGTANGGCSTVKPVVVTINAAPNLIITNPAAVCAPGTVDITAASVTAGSGAGLTYTYFTDAAATNVLNNPTAVNAGGTYYIKAANSSGCTVVKPVVVAINPLPTATISGGGGICAGSSISLPINLTGKAPWTVTYSNGTSTFTVSANASPYQLTVSPAVNTTYTLTGVTDATCSNTASGSAAVTVGTPITPVRYTTINATSGFPVQIIPGARIFTPNDQYAWSPTVGLNSYTIQSPTFTYDRTTEYLITIHAGTGCTVVDTLLVNVFPASGPPPAGSSAIFVPKAFSPNGDGNNDRLTPLLYKIKDLYYFRVFNRWGQMVFETNKMGEGWDGIFKGVRQGADVFTWTASGLGTDGVTHNVRGQSILLR
jgi:gliding motility-associated-like protein